jgi:hypothetical protein
MGALRAIIKAGKHTVCIGVYSRSHVRMYNPTILVRPRLCPGATLIEKIFSSSFTIATATATPEILIAYKYSMNHILNVRTRRQLIESRGNLSSWSNSTTHHPNRIEKRPRISQTNGCFRSDSEGREAHGVRCASIMW